MNITVLDGFTLNPGDLSWKPLEELGNLTVYERTPKELVVERSLGSEVLFTNKTVITAEDIAVLPDLKYIGVFATGYNVVDVEAAAKAGVTVTNIPAYSTMSVAQHIFSLILAITNHTEYYAERNRDGAWTSCADFSYTDYPMPELDGKRLGIVGYGNIGHAVAKIASAFGMRVCVDSSKPQSLIPEVEKMDRDSLFRECDIICLCCPLNADTRELINKDLLSKMKSSAILINTGRGGLVNEHDLAEALNFGRIYAAGLDVLSTEPPRPDNPLLKARNCFITQHIAWATKEARRRCLQIAVENLRAWIDGTPQNVVS